MNTDTVPFLKEDVESLNGLTCQEQHIDQLALVDGDRISLDPSIVLEYRQEFDKKRATQCKSTDVCYGGE